MNLKISNIGKIKTADIALNGITIIAGDNNTGKSTVGKILFGVFNSCYKIDQYIENQKIAFDMISLDCTNVDIPISDEGSHMGFPNIERVLHRLYAIGAIKESTVKYVNHFSHNGNPIHEILEKRAKEYDCFVSYDGCHVTF